MIPTAGIDFGNCNCVVAVPKDASVSVVLNESSNRLTPTMVCYTNDRRYSGELASQNRMQYPESTITDLKKMICLSYDSFRKKKIANNNNLVKLDDGAIGIKVTYHDRDIIVRPEQCIAFLLHDLTSFPECVGKDNFVMTVSPFWNESQRRSILNSFEIAKIKCACLLNATTAAAIAYILQHRQRLPMPNEKTVKVAFVDIGESSMTVAIAELKQQLVEMKAITYNEKVNGSKLTELFENYLLQKVVQKYKIDPRKSPRTILRFRQAVEKAKKVLSVNPVFQFEVHSLMNVDVSFTVKREEFNCQIQKIIEKLEDPVKEALAIASIRKEDIFELQLLGGTTRVIAIKDELTRIFGKEPKQSMNLDECFAIGSAYMAAYLSPKLRVPFVVKDITPHEVIAKWEGKTKSVFPQFRIVPCSKILKIPVKNKLNIELFDEDENRIAKIKIKTNVDHEVQVSLRLKLNQSCLVEVADGLFEKDGKTFEADIKTVYDGQMKKEEIENYIKIEDEMAKTDSQEELIDNAKNDLEGQIYILDDLLSKNFYNFVDPSIVESVKKRITQIQLWYEDKEFDRMPPIEYTNRAEELKKLTAPVIQRMNTYQSSVSEILSLKDGAVELLHKVEADTKHQTDPRRDKLMNNIMNFMQHLTDAKEALMHEEIQFDIDKNRKTLDNLTNDYQKLSGNV